MSRIDRVNHQLKREIGAIIQKELEDPRLEFVTITEADISRDLRHAKIYFSVLGNRQQADISRRGLEGASGIIRKYVGQNMKMRYTPELTFYYDESLQKSARIEETLKEIHDGYEESHRDDQK